jgi:hypothetical protein
MKSMSAATRQRAKLPKGRYQSIPGPLLTEAPLGLVELPKKENPFWPLNALSMAPMNKNGPRRIMMPPTKKKMNGSMLIIFPADCRLDPMKVKTIPRMPKTRPRMVTAMVPRIREPTDPFRFV